MERRKEIDVLRAIAIILIVLCHYCEDGPIRSLLNMGFFLGNFGNALFFSISALLFGLKYCSDGYRPLCARTMLRRRIRTIYIPLWIFLLILIPISNLTGYMAIDTSTTLFNVLGLGWLRPIKYAGHLWFITMLMICYLGFYIASKIQLQRLPKSLFSILGGGIVLIMYIAHSYLNKVSTVLPVICLFYSLFLFVKADQFTRMAKEFNVGVLTLFSVFISCLTIYFFVFTSWQEYLGLSIVSASITAISILALVVNQADKVSRLYPYFSRTAKLSYYIYLVHLPLESLIFRNIHNPFLSLIILLTLSYVLAEILKFLSDQVISGLDKLNI